MQLECDLQHLLPLVRMPLQHVELISDFSRLSVLSTCYFCMVLHSEVKFVRDSQILLRVLGLLMLRTLNCSIRRHRI